MVKKNPLYNFGIRDIKHASMLLATTILGVVITLSVVIGVGWILILLIIQLMRYLYAN